VKNRIKRLSYIITLLSKGYCIKTPIISKELKVSQKIIQTDFKEYILPLFGNNNIYYSYSNKCYKSKDNFLAKTLISPDELAIIAILKNKSKDKYSDKDLHEKVKILFKNYEDALSHSIYKMSDIEKIDKFKKEIIRIYHSIDNKKVIKCIYRDKLRNLYPLQIKNLDGFWYLICFDTNYKDIRKYHLNSLTDIKELDEIYEFKTEIIKKFDNAINAYYKPELSPIPIQLFLDKKVSKYFIRKPISKTQRIIKRYNDNSCDIELTVTDFMEIIPTIQKYIPYIGVIEPIELKDMIKANIKDYLKTFA